jgi:hemoglobin-like flavoprotein
MTHASVQRIVANYEMLADHMTELASAFYVRLFKVLPQARPLFKIDIDVQSQHLAAALAIIVRNLRWLDVLEESLADLGVHHARVGVHPEQYPIVCRAMVETIRDGSGQNWSAELEQDWTQALAAVSRIMMNGALRELAPSRASSGAQPADAATQTPPDHTRTSDRSSPAAGARAHRDNAE